MLKINHNAGFFSCCTIKLENIITYFNENKKLPETIDCTAQFSLYKSPILMQQDITKFFFTEQNGRDIPYSNPVKLLDIDTEQQFSNYKLLNYDLVLPFVDKYFTLSETVEYKIKFMEDKYMLDYSNICVIYYRGLGKYWETNIASYDSYINKAKEIKNANKDIVFLVQSDETEFFEEFKKHFDDVIIFNDEIYHIEKKYADQFSDCEKKLPSEMRINHSINFLAITKIMSNCKFIVMYSGNASLWVCLFRGNADGVYQYLSQKEYIYGRRNLDYNPSKTNHWC